MDLQSEEKLTQKTFSVSIIVTENVFCVKREFSGDFPQLFRVISSTYWLFKCPDPRLVFGRL
jgi:hypothetical protein